MVFTICFVVLPAYEGVSAFPAKTTGFSALATFDTTLLTIPLSGTGISTTKSHIIPFVVFAPSHLIIVLSIASGVLVKIPVAFDVIVSATFGIAWETDCIACPAPFCTIPVSATF